MRTKTYYQNLEIPDDEIPETFDLEDYGKWKPAQGCDLLDKKTLVAAIASHDSIIKNNELARIFECLYDRDKNLLGNFHFILGGGTHRRLFLGIGSKINPTPDGVDTYDFISKQDISKDIYALRNDVIKFLSEKVTALPDQSLGGITILANFIVQKQVSIIWPFLSPITEHMIRPENLALTRLCDVWNAKRLMNAQSVKTWFRDEAERDQSRNPQEIPPKVLLPTSELDPSWIEPVQVENGYYRYYRIRLPEQRPMNWSWTEPDWHSKTIALIAHDAMKGRMTDFANQYENELSQFKRILATGTTGNEVQNVCKKLKNLIILCKSGPKGGDIEIASEILFGCCDIVIFFIDPLNPHPHIDDIRVVLSACMAEVYNSHVQIITNEVHAREWVEEAVRRRNLSYRIRIVGGKTQERKYDSNNNLMSSKQRNETELASITPLESYCLEGNVVRQKIRLTNDFEQAGVRYRSLSKVDQDHLVDNIVDSLGKADKPIQQRMVENLSKADRELGRRVADGLKA